MKSHMYAPTECVFLHHTEHAVRLGWPWVHWTIEKRKESLKHKRETIAHWRQVIESFDFAQQNFANTGTYAEMRPYMSDRRIEMFENSRGSSFHGTLVLTTQTICIS
jgi:hypothetical protein